MSSFRHFSKFGHIFNVALVTTCCNYDGFIVRDGYLFSRYKEIDGHLETFGS